MDKSQNRTATLVTGASSGIGRSFAKAVARRGDSSLVLVGRDERRLEQVADECSSVETLSVAADLGLAGQADRVIKAALDRFGRIDTLVVNAGIYLGGDLTDAQPEQIDDLLRINISGAIQLVRSALPSMIERGQGDIVFVTSISGYQDIHWEPVYSASKHAMVSFAHTLRRQLVGSGLRVMSIGPGVVLSELWGYSPGEDRIAGETAAGRGIEVDDVSEAILFMLDRPRHVTIRDLVMLPTDQEI